MKTWFQQPLHCMYTWKSPGDISRNHRDCIMINERFRNCVKQARTYPGADINSDHNPVILKFKVKLKKIKINQAQSQIDYNLLKMILTKGDITYYLKTIMMCWDLRKWNRIMKVKRNMLRKNGTK